MRKFNIAIILLLTLNPKILADEISGFANITDGDTIKIYNKRIRLHGIDTPEKKQICYKKIEGILINNFKVSMNQLIQFQFNI